MKLVWFYIIVLMSIIIFWATCGYVVYHFITKYW